MTVPNELRPTTQATVYSLLAQAGVDVSLWAQCKGGKKKAASNPKYCYEWAFIQPGKVVVLNLWYAELREHGGVISERRNLREVSPNITGKGEHVRRRHMAVFEKAVAAAVGDRLPVRVIICDGPRRDLSKSNSKPSSARRRMLDPEVWIISEYDKSTGRYVAVRGTSPQAPLLDEEDFLQDLKRKVERSLGDSSLNRRKRLAAAPRIAERISVRSFRFQRNPDVIAEVLLRAVGKCEGCGNLAPFKKRSDKSPYLEVHHVEQLAEGGEDTPDNARALCPNCHRREHFG
jgi:5-methylcytosine-specific restriction protein A